MKETTMTETLEKGWKAESEGKVAYGNTITEAGKKIARKLRVAEDRIYVTEIRSYEWT